MTRLTRLFLFALLAIAIPFSAWAGQYASSPPCPMQSQGLRPGMDQAMPCCHGMANAAKAGGLCKAGQDCKAAPSIAPVQGIAFSPVKAAIALTSMPAFFPQSAESSIFWRPPRPL